MLAWGGVLGNSIKVYFTKSGNGNILFAFTESHVTWRGMCGPRRRLRYYAIRDTKHHCVIRFENSTEMQLYIKTSKQKWGEGQIRDSKLSEVSSGEKKPLQKQWKCDDGECCCCNGNKGTKHLEHLLPHFLEWLNTREEKNIFLPHDITQRKHSHFANCVLSTF